MHDNVDLPGLYLAQINLSSSDLTHAHLGHANLMGADMRNSDMLSIDLDFADLEADLTNATSATPTCQNTNLMGASMQGVNFCK